MKIFFETNPAIDEFTGRALGIFLASGYCLIGILAYHGQFGVILFNYCLGIWNPQD